MSSLGRSYFLGVLHGQSPSKQVVVGEPSPTQSNGSRLMGFNPPAAPTWVSHTKTTQNNRSEGGD